MSDVTTIEADVPERYADAVSARLRARRRRGRRGRRIWRRDGTLWAPEGTPEVTNRLGWLDIAEREREQLGDYDGVRARTCATRATRDAVVLGMGGSSLAPEVFRPVLRQGRPRADAARAGLDAPGPGAARSSTRIDLDRALMIVSSKSGGTIEPKSMFKAFHARQGDGAHFVAVTDPGTSLEGLAQRARLPRASSTATRTSAAATARCRRSGSSPPRLAGIDIGAVLDSAIGAAEECRARAGQRRACGSAARSASSPARAATSSRSWPTRR